MKNEFLSVFSFKEVFSQLIKDKFALIALIVLGILYLSVAFADFLAPYSKDFSDRTQSYVPPSQIFTIDEKGHFSKPYTYNYIREFDEETYEIIYKLDRSKKYYLNFMNKGEPYKLFGLIGSDRHLVGVEPEGRLFLLGTDINGRDVFSRLLFGGKGGGLSNRLIGGAIGAYKPCCGCHRALPLLHGRKNPCKYTLRNV